MAEHARIPAGDAALLRELEVTAAEQRRLTARLEQVKARRTDLVDEVRDRRLRTWRELAALFGMTETALQMARRAKHDRNNQ